MKKLVLILGLLSSVSAFAEVIQVKGSAKAYFEGDQSTLSDFIDQLAVMADENAKNKNGLCKVQQIRVSPYRVNQMPDYLGIKYKVDADYLCGFEEP